MTGALKSWISMRMGTLVKRLGEWGYRTVIGVDTSSEQVARAGELGVANVIEADLFTFLADNPSSFDIVLAIDVLEHLTKAEVLEALAGIRRALRGRGVLIVRVPNAQSPFSGRFRYGDFTHQTSFTQHSIRQVLLASGFSEVSTFRPRR